MAQVRTHDSAASCWTVVDGVVCHLTEWVSRHPGGRARSLSMCGKDATAAFRGEHGTQRESNRDLAGFRRGTLS